MRSPAEPRKLLVFREDLGQGGADRVTLTLLTAMARERFTPTLALARAEGCLLPELPATVPLRVLGATRLRRSWRPLAELLRREVPDILFSTSSGANVAAVLAARAAGFGGRLVLSERNGLVRDQPRVKLWPLLALKRWLYPRAHAVTAVSEGVRQDLIRRLRLRPDRVHTTYNPVVTTDLAVAAAAPLEHPWAGDPGPWLLAAGRLEPAKDFATLLAALRRLHERHPARLVVLGEGSQREPLMALAEQLGCAEAVAFPGFDPNPYRWMRRCTVFVLSSRFEGLPGVLIQAMACGAPVVATNCPFGPAEIVEHGVNGILVPVGDAEGLAGALSGLLDDPAARASMAARGRETSARFRLDAILPRYEEILLGEPDERAVSTRRPPSSLLRGDPARWPGSALKVALIGAGHIAEAHVAGWRRAPGCRVEGVFDIAAEFAAQRARRFGLPRVFTNLEEALAAADVVDICTPPETHAEIVERAARAGRHLLVEKPVVTNLADWDRLRPHLEVSPGRLCVVHNINFLRGVLRAKHWLAAGRIGRLLRLDHRFLTHPEADRMLARPHWSHELPGGRWFETLPHALYLIHTFAGPLAVTHVAARRTPSAPPGVPADEVAITFEGETCLANVHYSANCPANRRTFVLEGSEGCIDIDILSGAARLSRRRDTRWRRALGPGLTEPLAELARAVPERALTLADRLGGVTPHARLIAAFARHLHDDAPSPTPLAEVDYVVRQCDAIGRAIDRQAWGARAAG